MKHRIFGKKLNRDCDHRRSLLKNLGKSFFLNEGSLTTTISKAKAVKPLLEKAIRKIAIGDLISRRWLFSLFQDQKQVNELIRDYQDSAKKIAKKPIILKKLLKRKGDNAILVSIISGLFKKNDQKIQEKNEKNLVSKVLRKKGQKEEIKNPKNKKIK